MTRGREQTALLAFVAAALATEDVSALDLALQRLTELDGADWVRLDAAARNYGQAGSALEDVRDLEHLLRPNAHLVTLVAGSVCRDGRVRAVAVGHLATRPGRVTAAALGVRTADWFGSTAESARRALRPRVEAAELDVTVAVLLRLAGRVRGRPAEADLLPRFAAFPAAVLQELIETGERATVQWALGALSARRELADDLLLRLALGGADPVVARWCGAVLLQQQSAEPAALLRSRRAGVRALAVAELPDDQLAQGVAPRLLDRSGAVRSIARGRWTRAGRNSAPVYLEALASQTMPRILCAALGELAVVDPATASRSAWSLTAHPSPAVRAAALKAVAWQPDSPQAEAVFIEALEDPANRVASTALRYLRPNVATLPASVLTTLDETGTPRARRAALLLRQGLGTWPRVLANLAAITGQDAELARFGRRRTVDWVQSGAAHAYTPPTDLELQALRELLPRANLGEHLTSQIEFVAGIRRARPAGSPAMAAPSSGWRARLGRFSRWGRIP